MRSAVTVVLATLLWGSAPEIAVAQLRTSVLATGLTNPVAFVADPVDPATFHVVGTGALTTAVDLLVLTDLLGGTAELGLISSFGVDAAGEMYIVSYSRGRILKIVP